MPFKCRSSRYNYSFDQDLRGIPPEDWSSERNDFMNPQRCRRLARQTAASISILRAVETKARNGGCVDAIVPACHRIRPLPDVGTDRSRLHEDVERKRCSQGLILRKQRLIQVGHRVDT